MTRWYRPRLLVAALFVAACGDGNGSHGINPHLPEPGDIVDGAPLFDGPMSDGGMPDAALGMHCGASSTLVLPMPATGSVSAGAPLGQSMYMGSCGGGSGAEVIYYVTVDTQLSNLTFTVPQVNNNTFQPVLYVRTACDMQSSEVGCQAATSTTGATVTLTNPAMGTYFVFVDSPSNSGSGSYTLTVSGTIPEGQACDPQSGVLTCGPRHVCAERTAGQGNHCEVARCANGTDDDGDGKIDFPHDPGCNQFEDDDESDDCNMSPAGPNCPQCGNHVDDDGDGKIDYDPPAGSMSDPGCSSASDRSEIDECIPGVMVGEFDANGHAAGDTSASGAANHFAPSSTCAFSAPGNDDVWHYRVDQPTRSVSATMTPGSGLSDPVFYIRKNTCGDVASEAACQANFTSSAISLAATNLAVGNDVYFFVDSELSGGGTYTVQLDVALDAGAQCNSAVTWKHCGSGLKCQNNVCVHTQCADQADNDGDGKTDYPNDPGCTSPDDDSENSDTCMTNPTGSGCPQCGNGRDDDGDGFTDYPADPGCTSASDNNEGDDCVPMSGQPAAMVTDITATGVGMGMTSGSSRFHQATASCGSSTDPNGPEQVFEYRLTSAVSSMTVTTCDPNTNFDTVLYIRQGACFNGMANIEVGCNDDNGSASPAPPAGTCGSSDGLHSYIHTGPLQPGVYFIFVDGYSTTSSGTFTVHVTTTP